MSGDIGSAHIKPVVHLIEEATDIVLEYLGENDGWNETSVEIGRRKGRFEVWIFFANEKTFHILSNTFR